MQDLTALFATTYIRWIVILVTVDVVLGLVQSFTKGTFNLGKVAGFMGKGVLPYVLGFAVVELVATANPAYALLAPVVFVIVAAALLASILTNLDKLGVPVPKMFKKE